MDWREWGGREGELFFVFCRFLWESEFKVWDFCFLSISFFYIICFKWILKIGFVFLFFVFMEINYDFVSLCFEKSIFFYFCGNLYFIIIVFFSGSNMKVN